VTSPDRQDKISEERLTKLTVNLLPQSMAALNSAAERLGDSRTDTVNRAVQVYAKVTDLTPGEAITFTNAGEPLTLRCVNWLHRAEIVSFVAVLLLVAFAVGMWVGRG
jgi:hypothetical protein